MGAVLPAAPAVAIQTLPKIRIEKHGASSAVTIGFGSIPFESLGES
jgi:hypothetical protein